MDSYMETWVPLYGSVCVHPSHPPSGHTHWVECVHPLVHEFMSTWLPMSTPPPMDSLMEIWVPLFGIVCLLQSSYFWSHTSFRMCTCISTCIYVHLTANVCSIPMHSLMEIWVPLYGSVFVSQSPYFCSHTLFGMCTYISICIYVHMTPHFSMIPFA